MPQLDKDPLSYMPNSANSLRRFSFNRAPTTNDFRNFRIGDEWLDTLTNDWYKLSDKTASAGVWVKMAAGGSGHAESLTGDAGDIVEPDASFNINVVGNATQGVSSTGTAATNTLEFTVADATTTQKGVLETSTDAESITGTAVDKAVTPASLTAALQSPTTIGSVAPNTGDFTTIDLIGEGAGTQDVINIDPSGNIGGGVTWNGINIDISPFQATGASSIIHAINVDASGVNLGNDPELGGIDIELPATFTGSSEKYGVKVEGFGLEAELVCGEDNAALSTNGRIVQTMDLTATAPGDLISLNQMILQVAGSTGGHIHAIDVSSTNSGSAEMVALSTNSDIRVIHQHIGTFGAIAQGWKENGGFTDTTIAFNAAGTDVTIFDSNGDYIYVGMAAAFDQIQVILDTPSNRDLRPIFEYSTAVGFSTFTPTDTTNGFQQDGTIAWNSADLAGFAARVVNGANQFYIRIQRDFPGSATIPIEDTIQALATTEFGWDEDGDVDIRNLDAEQITVNSAFTLPTADGSPGQAMVTDGAGTVTWGDEASAGEVVQYLQTSVTGTITTGAIIPSDNTIPQIGEGTEVLTLAITPKAAANQIVIKFNSFCVGTGAAARIASSALFVDATGNALAAAHGSTVTNTAPGTLALTHTLTAGSTTARTYRIRCGPNGGGGNIVVNGTSGGPAFGGVAATTLEIWEIHV